MDTQQTTVVEGTGCPDTQDFASFPRFPSQTGKVHLAWAYSDVEKNLSYQRYLYSIASYHGLSLPAQAASNEPNQPALDCTGTFPQILSFLSDLQLKATNHCAERDGDVELAETVILGSLRDGEDCPGKLTCACSSIKFDHSLDQTQYCNNPCCPPGGQLFMNVVSEKSLSSQETNLEHQVRRSNLLQLGGGSFELSQHTPDTIQASQSLCEKSSGKALSTKSKIGSVEKDRLLYLSESILSQLDHTSANIRINKSQAAPEIFYDWTALHGESASASDHMMMPQLPPSDEISSLFLDRLLMSEDEEEEGNIQTLPASDTAQIPQMWTNPEFASGSGLVNEQIEATTASPKPDLKEPSGPQVVILEEGPGLIVPEIPFPRRYTSIDEVSEEALTSIRESFFEQCSHGFDSKYCLLQFGVQRNSRTIQELSNLFSNYGDIEQVIYNQYLGAYLYIYCNPVGAELGEKYLRPLNLIGMAFGLLRSPTELEIACVFYPPKVSARFTKCLMHTPKRRFSANSAGIPTRPNRIGKCLHITYSGTDKHKGSVLDLVNEAVSQVAIMTKILTDAGVGKKNMWFVEFETIEDAVEVVTKCHNMKVGSGQLRCSFTKNLQ